MRMAQVRRLSKSVNANDGAFVDVDVDLSFHVLRSTFGFCLVRTRILPLISALALLAHNGSICAQETSDKEWWGPYCGVYCVYAALDCLDVQKPKFSELLETKYISSRDGSTLLDLKTCALDHGLNATALFHLDTAALRECTYPVILHCKQDADGNKYNHWQLYLGQHGEYARVANPPQSVRNVTYSELLTISDGVGLVVSAEPIDTSSMRLASIVSTLTIVLASVCSIWLLSYLNSCASQSGYRINHAVFPAVGIITVSVGFSLVFHNVSVEGFFRNKSAVDAVQIANMSTYTPSISFSEVESFRQRNNAIILDSRQKADFEFGHAKGAVNLPASSSVSERASILGSYNKHDTFLIYCNSSTCPFNKTVAKSLLKDGYKNVILVSDGWDEWRNGLKQSSRDDLDDLQATESSPRSTAQ